MPRQVISDHSKLDNKTLPEWTGWGFTDAKAAMNCPKCHASAGEHCRTPKGRKAWPPHTERTVALYHAGYDANRIPAHKL